jgi:16S rRNA (guanine527-N7)-methyltransferase
MFHVKHEAWGPDARRLGLELSQEQLALLDRFQSFLLEEALPRGYIARSDRDRLWERHLLDSLRAAPEFGAAAEVLDLGSGAGLPGIPLAIATPARFTLAEERGGRAALLATALDRLGLPNAEVAHQRAEALGRRFDICVARAFASAAGTWEVAEPLLRPGGQLIYWAGSSFEEADIRGLGVQWRLSAPRDLADSGPLVIMSRQ